MGNGKDLTTSEKQKIKLLSVEMSILEILKNFWTDH